MSFQESANQLLLMPGSAVWAWMGTRTAAVVLGVVVLLACLWDRERRPLLIPAVLAVILSDLSVNRLLKPMFQDDRPCVSWPELLTAPPGEPGRCIDSYAFPSGHASNTAALGACLASPPLIALSGVVGAQRVVTAQHDAGDVAFGWMWGALLGVGARRAFYRLRRPARPARG